MQVTLTHIIRTPRVSKKTGKPFVSVGIKTQEHGDKFLSGFASTDNADWNIGDTVEIEVEQKGEYLNFKMPKRDSDTSSDKFGASATEIKNMIDLKLIPLMERNNAGIQKLEMMLNALHAQVSQLIKEQVDDGPEPDDDIPDDIKAASPF